MPVNEHTEAVRILDAVHASHATPAYLRYHEMGEPEKCAECMRQAIMVSEIHKTTAAHINFNELAQALALSLPSW